MNHMYSHSVVWFLLIGSLSILGCSQGDRPELGYVTGNATMDGEPLVGVIVTFKPDVGRPAVGVTDASGNYDIEYRYGVKGTKVGPSTASFSWPTGVTGSHPIPARYANQSDLKYDIKPGRNKFDFKLESDSASQSKSKKPAPVD